MISGGKNGTRHKTSYEKIGEIDGHLQRFDVEVKPLEKRAFTQELPGCWWDVDGIFL